MSEVIKIAIQKSGRLNEECVELLKKCDFKFDKSNKSLQSVCINFPMEVLQIRDDDIPEYVEQGTADIGIVGQDILYESGVQVKEIKNLGFSKCRLSLAIPKYTEYNGLKFFENKKVATSYPKLLKKFFKEKNINSDIHFLNGSVEIAPNIGISQGICDLVSSGSTLRENDLKEVEVILKSEATLISTNKISEEKRRILDDILFRIDAVLRGSEYKYIMLNAPKNQIKNIISIIPGVKSPTIINLADESWVAIHAVIKINEFWELSNKFKEYGAQGIFTVPIEKMIL